MSRPGPADRIQTVLIADDDARIRKLLTWTLEMGHFQVVAAADGLTALETAREIKPDLYLLDVGMPGMTGIELCRQLRAEDVISPILMLTGFGGEEDKVAGLEAGADDYQTKPFASRELLARIGALLRRAKVYTRDGGTDIFLTENLRIDFNQHLAYKADQQVELTPTEFKILAFLARAPGQVRASRAILQHVWGPAYRDEVHLLRVNVARLRRKIEDVASEPRYVLTHSRAGYSLAALTQIAHVPGVVHFAPVAHQASGSLFLGRRPAPEQEQEQTEHDPGPDENALLLHDVGQHSLLGPLGRRVVVRRSLRR
jgi:DNA-binding response OmpR family regulator